MNYLDMLVHTMHTSIMATVDTKGYPVTCAIDLMDFDEQGIYFLTAKGKGFYERLKHCPIVALSALKGKRCISLQGHVKEIGAGRLEGLFAKNPYMNTIYPNAASREALTVFVIDRGQGEYFDLESQPIFRESFQLGNETKRFSGYRILDSCVNCGRCVAICPTQCIHPSSKQMVIDPSHCLHCGQCQKVCTYGAIMKVGDNA